MTIRYIDTGLPCRNIRIALYPIPRQGNHVKKLFPEKLLPECQHIFRHAKALPPRNKIAVNNALFFLSVKGNRYGQQKAVFRQTSYNFLLGKRFILAAFQKELYLCSCIHSLPQSRNGVGTVIFPHPLITLFLPDGAGNHLDFSGHQKAGKQSDAKLADITASGFLSPF